MWLVPFNNPYICFVLGLEAENQTIKKKSFNVFEVMMSKGHIN